LTDYLVEQSGDGEAARYMPHSGGTFGGSSDVSTYARGHAAGGSIGLATQVSGKETRALPRR
jgi:hypothetical protein